MFSQFCRFSLNIRGIGRIRPHKYKPESKCCALQKCNYATVAQNGNVLKSTNLELIIKELKGRIENTSRLSHNDLQSLLTKLKSHKCDSSQALEILSCCSYAQFDQNLSNTITNIWNELKRKNNNFETKHYNCLMQYFINRGESKCVPKLFNEMIDDKIEPNAESYIFLLDAYCKTGEIDRAIEVLDLMDKSNFQTNESSFNYLVQCHIICGNLDDAYETIANLKQAGYKINFDTLEALLNYYAKSGDFEKIGETFELFKEQDMELLNRAVLKALCEMTANGHADKVDKLFSYIKTTNELEQSLQNTISQFVKRNQSPIVPSILRLADGNIKEMVKQLIEEMVRYSTPEQEFNETISNIEAMSITIENSFDYFKLALNGSSEQVIRQLLNHMKSQSMELNESVFEKLIELAAKKGATEVLHVVQLMCTDFNIQPQISFVRDHILPALNSKENPSIAFEHLQTTPIGKRVIVLAAIANSLNNTNIQTAYEFAKNNKTFYGIESIRQPLLRAFKTTKDANKFVSFVRHIHDSFSFIKNYYQDKTLTETEIAVKQKEFVSKTLVSAISIFRNDRQLILQLLKLFADEDLTITTEQARNIQNSLRIEGGTPIDLLLRKLSTNQIQMKPIKTSQLLEYIQEGNLTKIESLLASDKIFPTNSEYARLIDLYIKFSQLENAMNMLKRVRANNSEFKLDCTKVANLVKLMFENGRDFIEVEELLLNNRPDRPKPRIYAFVMLLDQLASTGYVKLVEKLFDALLKYNYVVPTVELAGSLILAHIKNGTYAEAVDKYEYIAKTFKFLSLTKVLLIELVEKKEMDLLKRVYNIHKTIYGFEAAQMQLVFTYIRCGQEVQAREILESGRIKNLSRYILNECKQCVTYNRLDAAKALLKVTKGLYSERQNIYEAILEIYEKTNNADEALKLWKEYSNEDEILPQPQFKTTLVHLLKANNIKIPPELQDKSDLSQEIT